MYVNYKRKTEVTVADVAALLATDDSFMEAAILFLHSQQRDLERRVRETFYKNEEGFQVADARMLSKFSERIQRALASGKKLGNCLSEAEKRFARRPWHRPRVPIPTICKYRWQVWEKINMEAGKRG